MDRTEEYYSQYFDIKDTIEKTKVKEKLIIIKG